MLKTFIQWLTRGTQKRYEKTVLAKAYAPVSRSTAYNTALPLVQKKFFAGAGDAAGDPYNALEWAAGGSEYMHKGSGSHELESQHVGAGTPTFTHSGLLLPDHEGVYYNIAANAAPWHGARKVTNKTPYSEDLQNAAWVNTFGSTTAGITDPDGGSTAIRLDGSSGAGFYYDDGICAVGDTVHASIWVRKVSGSGQVGIYNGESSSGTTQIQTNLTSSWQRFSGGARTAIQTNGRVGIRTWAAGDVIEIWHPQIEIINGQTNQNPSEYVATAGSATTKYYANSNGNTVLSNVVTEATGAALATPPSLYAAPALTNLVLHSNDGSNAAWTKQNCTATFDQEGLTGEPNTATLVTATATGANNGVRQTVTLSTGGSFTVRTFVRRTDTQWYRIGAFNFDTVSDQNAYFDILNGVLGTQGTGCEAYAIESVGNGVYACYAQFSTTTDLTGDIYTTHTQSDNNVTPLDTTSYELLNMEVFANKTIAQVKGAAPIVTAGATVTNTAVGKFSYDVANHNSTKGNYYLEWQVLGNDVYLDNIPLIEAGSNISSVVLSSGPADQRYLNSYINTSDTNSNLIMGLGTSAAVNSVGLAYDDAGNEVGLKAKGAATSAWTEAANFKSTPQLAPTKIQVIDSDYLAGAVLIRNIQRWNLPYTDAKAKIDELMT